jgi:hypothetical protein
MNKYKLPFTILLIAAATLNVGCMSSVSSSVGSAYRSAKSSLSSKDTETEALYAQVSDDDKQTVSNLRHELEVTEAGRELAKLERNRDDLQQDRSAANTKRMDYLAREQTYRVRLAKLEAIDRNKLGDRVTNIESITDTHLDALETQQKRLKMESEVTILDVKIEKLQEEINDKKKKIENLKQE